MPDPGRYSFRVRPTRIVSALPVFFLLSSSGALPANLPFDFDQTRDSFVFPLTVTPRLVPISDRIAFHAGDEESLAQAIEENHNLHYISTIELFDLVISEAVKGTSYQDKINIHHDYDQTRLNIYFLSKDALSQVSSNISICQYIPPYPLIICNGENLRSFAWYITRNSDYVKLSIQQKQDDGSLINLNKSDLPLAEQNGVDALLAAGMLGWILAHEIGHAVLHQKSGQDGLFFDGTVAGKLEAEADAFAAQQVLGSELLISHTLYAIDEWVERKFQEYSREGSRIEAIVDDQAEWASTKYKVRLNARDRDDLLTYRAVQIYTEIARLDPIRDQTGYYEQVSANIDLENERWRLFVPDIFERLFSR